MTSPEAAPDLIEPVAGFRKWRLEDGRLASPYVHVAWSEPVITADCRRTTLEGFIFGQDWLDEPHESPDPRCKCGIYAYHRPRNRSSMTYFSSVWGVVTLWGRIEVYRDGMRAQHARVHALALPTDWPRRQREAVRSVAADLGLDLVEPGALSAAAERYGRSLPDSLLPS